MLLHRRGHIDTSCLCVAGVTKDQLFCPGVLDCITWCCVVLWLLFLAAAVQLGSDQSDDNFQFDCASSALGTAES